jgi:hypothetical protein
MYAALRDTSPSLNWSGTATVQDCSHCRHPVQADSSTNLGLRRRVTWKSPAASRTIRVTSESVCTVTFRWCVVAPIFGVEMQLAQSRVGKTLLRRIILPPMLGSFSTRRTL